MNVRIEIEHICATNDVDETSRCYVYEDGALLNTLHFAMAGPSMEKAIAGATVWIREHGHTIVELCGVRLVDYPRSDQLAQCRARLETASAEFRKRGDR